MQNLNSLLKDNILASFYNISNLLLNRSILYINDYKYEFTEIEFYLKNDIHNDINVHQNDRQKTSNEWYVHIKGRGGIDITFGDKNTYAGILIRGLRDINFNNYISGPLNVLNTILKILNLKSRKELQNMLFKIDKGIMKIEENKYMNKEIFQAPRIGLVKESKYKLFSYRFIVDLNSKHKFKEKSKLTSILK